MTTKRKAASEGIPSEAKIRTTIKAAIDGASVKRVAVRLGLSREATLRLAGDLPVQKGTLLLAAQNLSNLDERQPQ